MEKIAVLIPCYNESQTIEKVIEDFKKALPEAIIYVYDNNSNDHTDVIAKRAGAVVRYEYRQGKGNVIRSMFREIEAECYILVDGDDTYPVEEAERMANIILKKQADMVIGDRLSGTYFIENKRPFHNAGNRLVRWLINTLFRCKICDIMTGYRAFSWEFVKGFPVLSSGFEIETEMSIHALDKNFRLMEIPVSYRDRPKGSVSKLHTWRDGMRILKTIFALFKDYKPLWFFGVSGGVLLSFGLGLFFPILMEFLKIGFVPRFPTLFVSGCLILTGIFFILCGILLDAAAKKHRQLFELFRNLLHETRFTREKEIDEI